MSSVCMGERVLLGATNWLENMEERRKEERRKGREDKRGEYLQGKEKKRENVWMGGREQEGGKERGGMSSLTNNSRPCQG